MAGGVSRQFGTDLAPTCDRCGELPKKGLILNGETLDAVCLDCLTEPERARFIRGQDPFSDDDGGE